MNGPRLAVAAVLGMTAFGCASQPASDRNVTCGARKVRLDKARKISLDMTLGQIESLLGPPEKDVGSGLFVLEWTCSDGTRIHVSAERRESVCLFSVQDNGIGIDSEYAQEVFRIFRRLHGQDPPGRDDRG